ncbi:MAG TPA: hypothetical protein VJC16_01360 [Candidatus Nanoarchaeia archaeon]|nr:hypothetical protein [Candidatus Nanoarchaeia archaeon]
MKRTKRWKAGKGKMPKLNKRFMYAVAGIGLFLVGSGVQVFDGGITGNVAGASPQDVGLLGFGVLAAGLFLAGFAVHHLVTRH